MDKALLFLLFTIFPAISGQIVNSDITSPSKGSIVDLGYSQYQGYVDNASGMEFYLGIRYASPPKRWQAAVKPARNRSSIIQANVYGSQCFQSSNGGLQATSRDFTGSEDCLFLNVWKPANTTSFESLPVLVYIHGGGYGIMNAQNDPTFLAQVTAARFIFVSLEYRLGAFGFLSSAEIYRHGVVNAGLLDQNRALNWVQEHIAAFNGDPDQVTIFGESAGAGSVMQQLLSYGGSLGSSLFRYAMMASPYLPKQYKYDDAVPTKFYHQFAEAAGCSYTTGNYDGVYACLALKDAHILANASQAVSTSAFTGTWAFTPVTDGLFLREAPSQQLATGKLNGEAVLVGNNAHEGEIFTPINITTSGDFQTFVQAYLPNLNTAGIGKLLTYYPEPANSNGQYNSQYARAALFVGDGQFVCPGNWIADAYSTAYRYKYSVPGAYHGLDLPNYLPNVQLAQVFPSTFYNYSTIFDSALTTFLSKGDPSNSAVKFPLWNFPVYGAQIDYNVTNAVIVPLPYVGYNASLTLSGTAKITVDSGLALTNGRDRCDFWRAIAPIVPM